MALVPASSRGTAFNGGTVTGATVMAPSAVGTEALQIVPPAAAAVAQANELEVQDGHGSSVFLVDAAGNLQVTSSSFAPGATIIDLEAPGGTGTFNVGTLSLGPSGARGRLLFLNNHLRIDDNAAAATADFGNSQFQLWLDDTPGATKLMVKAKDSGGTVRTATIALA